jgi:hypothetical protein
MRDSKREKSRTITIVLISRVLFIGSLLALLGGALVLVDETIYHFKFGVPLRNSLQVGLLVSIPIGLSVLGIVISVGLWHVREWARKGLIALSTLPILSGVALISFHNFFFPPFSADGVMLVVGPGIFSVLYAYLLVILVPISIWWLIALTRDRVRSQFR